MITHLLSFALLVGSAICVEGVAVSDGQPGLTVADRYAAGDQFAWAFDLARQPIGQHLFRYEGPVQLPGSGAHRFRLWTRLKTVPGLPVETLMVGELITDDHGHALHQSLEVSMGESYSRVDVVFADGRATSTIQQGGGSSETSTDTPTPIWSQVNNMLGCFDLALSLNPIGEEQLLRLDMFSSSVLSAFEYSVWWVEEAGEADPPGATTILKDSLGEMLAVDADGHLLSLEVASAGLVIRRTDEPFEPFEVSQPQRLPPRDDFVAEDVRIDHGDVSLAGTITRLKDRDGPRPAVLFLSGSGPQDRNGFSSGIDTGTHEILDALTERGFLVLRFDDRGVGQSTGPTDDMALTELVDDARACVDFLMARDDVDADRVAVIGHSEGGISAPLLALERPRLAALVLMATIARPLPEVMLEQNALALSQADLDPAEQAEALEIIRERFAQLASDEPVSPSDLEPEFAPLAANRRWFRQHARHDALDTLARVRCPVLVIQGGRDFQVSPERDAPLLAATLDEAGHDDHALVVLPDLDHLFKRVQGEESSLADYFTSRPVDTTFLETLADWLSRRLEPER